MLILTATFAAKISSNVNTFAYISFAFKNCQKTIADLERSLTIQLKSIKSSKLIISAFFSYNVTLKGTGSENSVCLICVSPHMR